MSLSLELRDESATQGAGAALGRALLAHPGFVTLAGDLGAGKTTLVRAALRALGHAGAVRSPTYTLIESYTLEALTVHHLDCYRLGGDDELDALGFRDLLEAGQAVLLEWPERVADTARRADLEVTLHYVGDGRRLEAEARGPEGAALLKAWSAELA
jgi:tRNA threonylcarbamoyladenosine biosynthesis protein TsaE